MANILRQAYKYILPYETRLWLYKQRHKEDYLRLRTRVNSSEKGDFSLKAYDELQCIFIHITKTAGTSIAKCLFGYLPYHYTAIDYRVIYGRNTFNEYFKFAFVRNPWDRLYSAYRYLKAGGWDYKDKAWSDANLGEFNKFSDFVKYWVNEDNIKKHLHFRPQCHFICDKNNKLLINHLAYFETINDDYLLLKNHFNLSNDLKKHNANPGKDYRLVYDDESIEVVNNVYSQDVITFGYDFDGIKTRRIIENDPLVR